MIKIPSKIIVFLCFFNIVYAQSVIKEEVLESLKPSTNQRSQISNIKNENTKIFNSKKKIHVIPNPKEDSGNLPSYAIRKKEETEFHNPTRNLQNKDYKENIELQPGLRLKALISQDIIAHPLSQVPVTAVVIEGKFKGSRIYAEAFLNETTKRVEFLVKSIETKSSKEFYTLTAKVQDANGMSGLEGEYQSDYWNYFWAQAILNTVAGFAQSSIEKTPSLFGSQDARPGLDTNIKQGASIGLMKSAERIDERLKKSPEYVKVLGPSLIQIIVTD